MTATPREIDFSRTRDKVIGPSGVPGVTGAEARRSDRSERREGNWNAPRTPEGKLLTAKQIRARARRRAKRAELMSDEEFNAIYKPIEEWDLDELAHGRPRGPKGTFAGPTPKWITRDVHERSMDLFKAAIRGGMNERTPNALDAIQWILQNDELDDKGKPIVSASTKLDAAKFLLEHVVGKPTQRVESDVSVKLQSILGVVMANPNDALNGGGYDVGHLPGVTMPMATAAIEGVILDDDYDLDENDG